MKTHNALLLGVIAAVIFAFTPLASAGSHGGGGGHGGGAHFSGGAGGFHGGGFNRAGGFNRNASLNGRGSFNRAGGLNGNGRFNGPTGFSRSGNFANGGNHHNNCHNNHHHHHHGSFVFYDPFYYGWGFPYWGYDYGYGYAGYEAYPSAYYEGGYGSEDYSLEMDVQSSLADRGYYRGPIDGVIGNGTRRAVRAFQRDAGLPATGRIDSRLLRALRAS